MRQDLSPEDEAGDFFGALVVNEIRFLSCFMPRLGMDPHLSHLETERERSREAKRDREREVKRGQERQRERGQERSRETEVKRGQERQRGQERDRERETERETERCWD
jgi:hypothetical protein